MCEEVMQTIHLDLALLADLDSPSTISEKKLQALMAQVRIATPKCHLLPSSTIQTSGFKFDFCIIDYARRAAVKCKTTSPLANMMTI